MAGSPTTFDMSLECKAMVVKKVYEHYTMNILWREICQKFSTMCIFIFPTISFFAQDDSSLHIAVVFVSAIISLLVAFFCGTEKYYQKLKLVREAYCTDCIDSAFEEKYKKLLPEIREIDFARGRSDYQRYCLEHNIIQKEEDKLTKHDKKEMNRQRLIIAAMCFFVMLICGLLLLFVKPLDNLTIVFLLFIILSTFAGFVLMLVDCREKKG